LKLQSVVDLANPGVLLVNREPGSGARLLLDGEFARIGVDGQAVSGYDREVAGHLEVAREVVEGRADAGVSTSSVAKLYGLDFLPIATVRYDLAAPTEFVTQEPLRTLLTTLQHRWVRTQLRIMGGYDTARTGEVVEEL
jgi:molybdate-binding protein